MNIFYIPSWYPSKEKPYHGIFFKEQALALGQVCPQCQIIISLWGYDEFSLPINNPIKFFTNARAFLKARPYFKKITTNVWEYLHPALGWNQRLFQGNIRQIIAANEQNFLSAQKKFGRIDLIHAQVSFRGGYIAMKIAQKYHLPYIITEHMGPFPYPAYLKKGHLSAIIQKPLQQAQAIIAVSPYVQKTMARFGFKRINVIPNLVDENFFKPKKVVKNKNFTFFSLGNIAASKGIMDLIQAILAVKKIQPEVVVKIGGQGQDLVKFQKASQLLGLTKNIQWLGPLSRKQACQNFQKCDAFVLPSHHESFGVVYIEALSCGKPIIATRCGGPQYIVTKNNGLLIKKGDIEGLAQAMLYIINHYQTYSPRQIRTEFLKKFAKKKVTDQILLIYEQAIKNYLKEN